MKYTIKKQVFTIFLLSILILVVVIGFSYKAINQFVIHQEIKKARLISHTLFYTREYLALVAPYVKLKKDSIHPFALTPAYAVGRIALILKQKENFTIKQTSDRYRNKHNKPDLYELQAIKYFKHHKDAKELYQFVKIRKNYVDEDLLRYYYPLKITQSCLKCHGDPKDIQPDIYHKLVKLYGKRAFGYKLGDVRGMISVTLPMEEAYSLIDDIFIKMIFFLVILYIFGAYFFLRIYKHIMQDIETINTHFKDFFKNTKRFSFLRKEMYFYEFETMKQALNNSIKSIRKYQQENFIQSFFHPLTHLPNRKKLLQKLDRKKEYTIILLDVDRFKEINLYYSETIGDKLIKKMARRIHNKKLYHIKIDQFAILSYEKEKEQLVEYAQKLIKKLEEAYVIDGNEIHIKVHCGIAQKSAFFDALTALSATKILGKDVVCSDEIKLIKEEHKEHILWLKKLRNALQNDKIVPFYQPILDKERKIVKYEALVRLIDEDDKVISPFFFLEIAKQSRLYFHITKIMIEKALDDFRTLPYDISINLTTKDLASEEMNRFILKKIKQFEQPQRITFEIVEDEDIKSQQKAFMFLQQLKELGCQLSIDDFGSGYSNFDYLLHLNADNVKIDGSLIKDILDDNNSQIILRTIIAFTKEAKKKTIAEYVENEAIFTYLKEAGVDFFQGYYFSKPLSFDEIKPLE